MANDNEFLKTAGWKSALLSGWTPPWIDSSIFNRLFGLYTKSESILIQSELNQASALTGIK